VSLIGILVGLEIPLIMRIMKRDLSLKDLVSQVLTFDYLGALAVSILFPLVLVPHIGLVRSACSSGCSTCSSRNLGAVAVPRATAQALWLRAQAVASFVALLAVGFGFAGQFTSFAEAQLYADEIVYTETTPYQRIVSRAGRTICASSSTTTCSSRRATSIAITKRWCIQGWRRCPVRGASWCSAAATAWPCAKS
jgi:predicted membrane-bound spermidine synthase